MDIPAKKYPIESKITTRIMDHRLPKNVSTLYANTDEIPTLRFNAVQNIPKNSSGKFTAIKKG